MPCTKATNGTTYHKGDHMPAVPQIPKRLQEVDALLPYGLPPFSAQTVVSLTHEIAQLKADNKELHRQIFVLESQNARSRREIKDLKLNGRFPVPVSVPPTPVQSVQEENSTPRKRKVQAAAKSRVREKVPADAQKIGERRYDSDSEAGSLESESGQWYEVL